MVRKKSSPKKHNRILVVDQEEDIRGFLQTVLACRQFDVILAPDEKDGRQKLLDQCPDLLILDALLPRQGMEALLKCARKTPVLFISAIPLKVLLFRHKLQMFAGFQGGEMDLPFLEKPLQEDELLARIHKLLGAGGSKSCNP